MITFKEVSFQYEKDEGQREESGIRDMAEMPLYERAGYVASVFQNPKSQFFNTDAESEIVYGLENRGLLVEEIDRRLERTVKELHLEQLCTKSMFALYGGEKQRIAFASAFITDAPVVVLDEPSANLDAEAVRNIRGILEKIKRQGKTILIAEHRVAYLKGLADTVCFMEEGRIRRKYTAEEFYAFSDEKRRAMGLRCLMEEGGFPDSLLKRDVPKRETVLEIKDLTLAYKKQIVQEHLLFRASAGEIVGITGRNGSGKTTFLRAVSGLAAVKCGSILINGKKTGRRKRRKLCAMVMQDVNYQLFSDCVENECLLGNPGAAREKVKDILSEMGLSDCLMRHPQSLSGGQKQRLVMAAACVAQKQLLLLDEPTSGLDYRSMQAAGRALKRLAQKGMLILVVTHDREFAETVCDRLFFLEKRREPADC
ncbi:ATP-binding cassette domain-containing protein [Marvinbryantia formatexigens]|uniref:ATP-binding cassette domain-containing protein n=1 Tax=Marvinbryantia formatexigens TaxID=168384 RepID=UPI0002FD4BAA|nr:ABC transporter ATP-binding protein [Marvinbryantia formatexigens]UWO24380.1 ABC transporter ATP-binding protein [Marvinbryantia formatexigens DSM 14469]SDF51360.1 energy-coupling factor transport system ATP-binding protein [Marvinbryantia formatexigens]